MNDDTDLIKGRSLIKKNKEVTTDLHQIRDNKLTILNHICIPEGTPPVKKDLNVIYPKKEHSISTSPVCVHPLR